MNWTSCFFLKATLYTISFFKKFPVRQQGTKYEFWGESSPTCLWPASLTPWSAGMWPQLPPIGLSWQSCHPELVCFLGIYIELRVEDVSNIKFHDTLWGRCLAYSRQHHCILTRMSFQGWTLPTLSKVALLIKPWAPPPGQSQFLICKLNVEIRFVKLHLISSYWSPWALTNIKLIQTWEVRSSCRF